MSDVELNTFLGYVAVSLHIWHIFVCRTNNNKCNIIWTTNDLAKCSFCSNHDGVLESNTTIVKDKFQGIPSNMKNIWLGKYEAYSKWTYVRGLYEYILILWCIILINVIKLRFEVYISKTRSSKHKNIPTGQQEAGFYLFCQAVKPLSNISKLISKLDQLKICYI